MNKKEKEWLESKINTLKEISLGIKNTLEYTDLHMCPAFYMWIDNFIKEINERLEVYK